MKAQFLLVQRRILVPEDEKRKSISDGIDGNVSACSLFEENVSLEKKRDFFPPDALDAPEILPVVAVLCRWLVATGWVRTSGYSEVGVGAEYTGAGDVDDGGGGGDGDRARGEKAFGDS